MTRPQTKRPLGRPKGEKTENAARRRLQLVEAAIDSIVEHGMSATTLATVAKAAGLSQGVAVFYFKSKENLLVETLRYHYMQYQKLWKSALDAAPDDPVEKLMGLVFADLDPKICTARNLTLWNSYWGEAAARPRFAKLCDAFDGERYETMVAICEQAAPLMVGKVWSPGAVADALDTMTDGMWIRMHITPEFMDNRSGRLTLARFMATIFPSRADRIMAQAERLSLPNSQTE